MKVISTLKEVNWGSGKISVDSKFKKHKIEHKWLKEEQSLSLIVESPYKKSLDVDHSISNSSLLDNLKVSIHQLQLQAIRFYQPEISDNEKQENELMNNSTRPKPKGFSFGQRFTMKQQSNVPGP